MKTFIYKSLIVFFLFLIIFEITISRQIKKYDSKINELFSKEMAIKIKQKVRDEVESSINNDRILSESDAKLLNKFLKKITKEIENAEN
tara:strand:+ start:495 stop:761 length:267 start_codon:yes stop_codon:yes gene_type:complete